MSAPTYTDSQGMVRNMYDCPACPGCGSMHRDPGTVRDVRAGIRRILCGDCGHTEPWDSMLTLIHATDPAPASPGTGEGREEEQINLNEYGEPYVVKR